MAFELGLKTQRNILMAALAVLTANAIPVTANLIKPILSTEIPIPLIENVGGLIGLAGLVTLYWLINKDI